MTLWLAVLGLLLSSVPVFGQQLTVEWDDASNNENSFILDRQASGAAFVERTTTPANTPTFVDTQVTFDVPYCYKVKARNAAGDSAYSNTACKTPSATAPNATLQLSCTQTEVPTPTGLVLALNFNAGSGTTVADSSGSNNNGTISGATWITTGKYSNALLFDGVDDKVTVADANSLDLTTGMTQMVWVYPTAITSWRSVLIKEEGGLEGKYGIYANINTDQVDGYVRISGVYGEAKSPGQLALNTWTHIATTYDGANVKLYLNGVLVTTTARTGAMSASTLPFLIGGASFGSYFQGRIDDVRVYNRALTPAEIQTDMNTAIP